MNDAARSAKQNIREGYRRDTLGEFIRSIKISMASFDELEGDIDDCYEDGLITKEKYNEIKDLMGKTQYQILTYLNKHRTQHTEFYGSTTISHRNAV